MKADKKQTTQASNTTSSVSQKGHQLLGKDNYKFIIIGTCITMLGYLLLIGGKSPDPNVFLEDDIYGFRRLTLSPIIILSGFGVVFYGLLKKSKDSTTS